MSSQRLPSMAGRRALLNIARFKASDAHLSGRSQAGGHSGTMLALRRAGLITLEEELTPEGVAMVERLAGKPGPQTGITVVLEDHGQDFLEFDIKGGHIVATRPFQGGVWNGAEVFNRFTEVGDHLFIRTADGRECRTILYPVIETRTLQGD